MEALKQLDPRRLGPYKILATLGSGGMGRVYLGTSEAGEKVAVKVIKADLISGDDDILKRFAAEAENLRGAYGSRLARFENADLTADRPWLATEYVAGLTLQQFVAASGPLNLVFASAVGAMLAEGLESVHKAGLLHRDLKPRNVIMGLDGPKVIDLGLAVFGDREDGLTLTGMLVGTPAYMAPEQARSEPDLTTAVDVYALGATLVFTLTGQTVYPNVGGYDLIDQIRNPDQHPQTGKVPTELRTLINTMLAYTPTDRPTLRAVKRRLIQVAQSEGESIADVRIAVAEYTYVKPAAVSPPAPGNTGKNGVPGNAGSSGTGDTAQPDDPWGNGSDSGTGFDGAGAPNGVSSGPTPPRPREPIDLGWLVERLRQGYARGAPF